MAAQYVIGIDLGTTNSVLAYAPLDPDELEIELLPIPQLVAPGLIESRTSLPSFLYLAADVDPQLNLPWATDRDFAVGEFARKQSADVPDRTVGGAKSWLAHSRVDRQQPLLPWEADESIPKVSPVEASRRYLEHLVAAWDHAHPDAPLVDQAVVVTVPASFDASARELTREAAKKAGLSDDFVLLEEPQAAIYSWLSAMGDGWRKQLHVGETLLVVDVGGGTTDLTLVRVDESEGELELHRVAVGDHLLVGGDNMDLALAHHAAEKFSEKGIDLDAWQSVSLWHACRSAKETLLGSDAPKKAPVSVLGRGRKLIGGTVSIDLERDMVANLLLEGFFPQAAIDELPQRQRTSGFLEMGLPFESDPAVTRHVLDFLSRHSDSDTPITPTKVLVNGGVFKSSQVVSRLIDTLGHWFPEAPPSELAGERDLDHAVALGAASYGWAKRHGGMRIRGGTARSYYVGIETAGLAIPGAPRPLRALCVVPRGMEEGTEADVPAAEIGLVVGETAQFRFFSSATRKEDEPGTLLSRWTPEELTETAPLEAQLDSSDEEAGPLVPVRFQSKITELGVFELWCVSTRDDQRWKLEFSVREDEE